MIAVIADDLSGAAELAGIAAARGFKAEVQTVFDPESDAEVIAVDTDTRLKRESDAVRIVGEVTRRILARNPAWIFKKADSVLRGHVRAEIEAVLDATGRRKCVLIPANPSRGRIISGGRYFIDGIPLNGTVFAHDPAFPRGSGSVRELIGESARIETPDAAAPGDFPRRMETEALAAGAADFFASLLHGICDSDRAAPASPRACGPPFALFLCGSLAAWKSGRADQMRERGFRVQTMEQPLPADVWQQTSRLFLATGEGSSSKHSDPIEPLLDAALPIVAERKRLGIGLEGGATALAFIRRMGWTRFSAVPEAHNGVGTLRSPAGSTLWIKPGSYPWPDSIFGSLGKRPP